MRLIDADELLKTNVHIVGSIMTPSGKIQNIDAVQVIEIENAPTIDAVPVKHGKWTPIVNVYGRLEGWLHIECGRQTNEMSNYCPNCGAKMDWEV